MTIDDLEARWIPPTPVEDGGRKGRITRWKAAQERIKERERMAMSGWCPFCPGKMDEDNSLIRGRGVRFFVCKVNQSHSIVVIVKE